MFKTGSYITIGDYEFPYCCDVEIVSDIEVLTDICKITLPRRHDWDLRKIALGDDPILKRKDPVLVKFGYDGYSTTEFIGFVKDIKAGTPVTIECEDYMMLLKQKPISASLPASTTLKQLLATILPKGVQYKTIDVQIGDWRIKNVTPAKVLEELKSKFGFFSYFRLLEIEGEIKPVLYVGWAYWIEGRKEEEFEFGRNIIDDKDLVYKVAEDVRLKLKVVSVGRDNRRIEYEFGDTDGELRTVHYYNATAEMVKERAMKDLERFKYTGYRGGFATFGEPSMRPGDIASIVGNKYHPDGKYLIKKVVKNCGVNRGIKQTIEPNKIVNDASNDT